MEIGTGIFLATCIGIAVWQIDKRQAWRKVGRISFWLFVLLLIGALGLVAVAQYDNYIARSKLDAEVKAIREGNLRTIEGIELGSTRVEVRYLLGDSTNDPNEPFSVWSKPLSEKAVRFNDAGLVDLVLCATPTGDTYFDCDAIAGINSFSTEKEVLEKLGSPVVPATFKGDAKFLSYGKPGSYLDICLKKGRVAAFVIYSSPSAKPRLTYEQPLQTKELPKAPGPTD